MREVLGDEPSAAKACRDCAHWQAHENKRRGFCLQAPFTCTTYKLVGSLGSATVYEETKADYWCTLFAPKREPNGSS